MLGNDFLFYLFCETHDRPRLADVFPTPGIAAGHPETAEAGFEILADGGSAADAAVAATLASCVAETVMTGILGGGHAIYFDSTTGRVELLDCFVTVPGLDAQSDAAPMQELPIEFGEATVDYLVGASSCAVPGIPGGLHELWSRYGSLSWSRLVAPALKLARNGATIVAAHAKCLAMLEPVMTMREGGRIYAPGGRLLEDGDRLEQPGLVSALEVVAEEGAGSFYRGTLADEMLELIADRGGIMSQRDLDAYGPRWVQPTSIEYADSVVHTRGGLAGVGDVLKALPSFQNASEATRAVTLARSLTAPRTASHTTNVSVVDRAGNACVMTTSLGVGSGDFLPTFDIHLNSMLGESDLLVKPLEPGERMASMMAPTIVKNDGSLLLAAGSAGGTRLRGALVQVLSSLLDEGIAAQPAVERPRLHPDGRIVHLEPGFGADVIDALRNDGYEPQIWDALHHYFGGVSVVTRAGAAADPRRSGRALALASD